MPLEQHMQRLARAVQAIDRAWYDANETMLVMTFPKLQSQFYFHNFHQV
jgi:hypothetical protein